MSKKKRRHKISKRGLPPGSLVYTGDRAENPSVVLSMWFNEPTYDEQHHYHPEWAGRSGGLFWTDVRGLTDTKLVGQIGQDFQIHPLALEDVLNTHQRAKMEEYDNGLFFVLHNLRLEAGTLELSSEQIALFAGNNFVISFQEDPDDTFSAVRTRAREGLGRLRKKGSDYLTYALVDNIVDGYYLVLDELDSQVLELEEEIYTKGINAAIKERIFDLKRVVNQIRHRLLPLRDALTRFQRTEWEMVDESNRPYLRDVSDHIAQLLDSIDNQRDLLDSMEAFYQAEAANRLNDVMRVLTVISTIFIPLSFLAGVYGMNFEHMPELHFRYGYFAALTTMFMISLLMLYYFRKKKWL